MSQFAATVAARLGLNYLDAVQRQQPTPPQGEMENSYQQARNVSDAFAVHEVPGGPVILIDDTVNSRWTFTVIAGKLRAAGSGPVYAVALADSSTRT
jgi:ATP-dependent DNA helicase RecQ